MELGRTDMLGGLDALAADPAMGEAMMDMGADTVTCQACAATIDAQTGEPLSPIGPDNVAAVQAYESQAQGAMQGGEALVDAPPVPGGPPLI